MDGANMNAQVWLSAGMDYILTEVVKFENVVWTFRWV